MDSIYSLRLIQPDILRSRLMEIQQRLTPVYKCKELVASCRPRPPLKLPITSSDPIGLIDPDWSELEARVLAWCDKEIERIYKETLTYGVCYYEQKINQGSEFRGEEKQARDK